MKKYFSKTLNKEMDEDFCRNFSELEKICDEIELAKKEERNLFVNDISQWGVK